MMFGAERVAGGEVTRYRMARTLLGKPIIVASCYRLGSVLVDAGPTAGAAGLRRALRGERVAAVLVTHGHEDHVGNTALVGARTLGAAGLRVARGVPAYRRIAWGEPRPAPVEPVGDGYDGGGYELRPVATPGHTPDHLAYWEPSRGWLFAGDAALGPIRYVMRGEDPARYLESLRRMRDLKPEAVFPSHGPVLERPVEQLGSQIARLERLRDEARRLAAEGLGEGAIARRLLGPPEPIALFSGGEFRKALLIRGLLGRGREAP